MRLILALLFSCAASASWAQAVAQVLFVHGDVQAHTSAGVHTVAEKQDIRVGTTLVSGSNGHLQLRFIDGAFVSLRPHSRLLIEDYRYSSDAKANRVRFSLAHGTGRFVTGKAGEANKAGFRVNTPLAAIGIRGTDFTVHMQNDLLQTRVHRGAIVVARLGGSCVAEASGACTGALTKVLTERQLDHILELRATDQKPSLAPVQQWQPEPLLPAVEPSASVPVSAPDATPTAEAATEPATAVAAAPAATESVYWGHWSPENHEAEMAKGNELVGHNALFALYRQMDTVNLPTTGQYEFKATRVEAYALDRNGQRERADILNPRLVVDFADSTFSTQALWVSKGKGVFFSGDGEFNANGLMMVNSSSNMKGFFGAIASDADSAAYAFEGAVPLSTLRAYGLIRWSRALP